MVPNISLAGRSRIRGGGAEKAPIKSTRAEKRNHACQAPLGLFNNIPSMRGPAGGGCRQKRSRTTSVGAMPPTANRRAPSGPVPDTQTRGLGEVEPRMLRVRIESCIRNLLARFKTKSWNAVGAPVEPPSTVELQRRLCEGRRIDVAACIAPPYSQCSFHVYVLATSPALAANSSRLRPSALASPVSRVCLRLLRGTESFRFVSFSFIIDYNYVVLDSFSVFVRAF